MLSFIARTSPTRRLGKFVIRSNLAQSTILQNTSHSFLPFHTSSERAGAMNGQPEAALNGAPKSQKVHGKLLCCFDGTGNRYSGDTSDTNIVKLYQKFDRHAPKQFHYYQRE